MPTPPSQATGSPVATVFNSAGAPHTTGSITVAVGDHLLALWACENEVGNPTVSNSGTAQTWTALPRSAAATGWGQAAGWTATSTVAASMTVTVSVSPVPGMNGVAFFVYRAANSDGFGVNAHAKSPTSPGASGTLPSLALSCSDNSAVAAVNVDWSALSHGATRSYNVATAGTATEQQYFSNGSNYSEETWYHADVGGAGAKTIGMTTPTNQTWSALAVEVLAHEIPADNTTKPALIGMFTPQLREDGWF